MFVFAVWSLDLVQRHQTYKIPCLFPLRLSFGLRWTARYTSWGLQFLSTYFNLNNVINFLANDTNNCVDCLRSEGFRTWDENLSTIIFSWVVFCAWKFSRNFIHATVKAAFLFFLSPSFSLKRSIVTHSFHRSHWLIKSEKVDEWLSDKMSRKSFSWWIIFSLSPCSMPVASLLLRKQLKTTRLPFLVNCFQ